MVLGGAGRLMATFGLVVEGYYDEAVLRELIQKCTTPSEVDIICRPCGNAPQVLKKFPGFLEEFRHVKLGSHVDKAVVVRDADRMTDFTLRDPPNFNEGDHPISRKGPTPFQVVPN